MKKIFLLLIVSIGSMVSYAQVSKTIYLTTAGTLKDQDFSPATAATITDFTITGKIDARDFQFMRDSMDVLANLDLSGSSIVAYSGTGGTDYDYSYNYLANELPAASFLDKASLVSIELPSGVTCIRRIAFENCTGLTSISIPSRVTSIREGAFEGCSGLASIDIPFGVTNVEDYVFRGCSGLTSINIPSRVIRIRYSAFEDCSGLTSINIPSGVTSIESGAFSGCSGLTSINIPSGVTSIERGAFSGCSGLTSINIPSGVTSIGSFAFQNCNSLTSITIPSGVTSIESGAFSRCSGLTSINIPSGVTSIESDAFYGCSGLTSIFACNPVPVTILSDVFYNVNKTTCTLKVHTLAVNAYKAKDVWKDFDNIEGGGYLLSVKVSNGVLGSVNKTDSLYELNTIVNLTATPNKNCNFRNWTSNGIIFSTNSSTSVNVIQDTFLVANFVLDSLNVITSGTNGNVTGGGKYECTKIATLTATANTGYKFKNWTSKGSIISTTNPFTFTVAQDTSIIANFEELSNDTIISFAWTAETSSKFISVQATQGKTFTVDWGDDSTNTYTGNGLSNINPSHTYNDNKDYTVTVIGDVADCFITYLNVWGKSLKLLDVSGAPALQTLYCDYNYLAALDVSKNTALKTLDCYNNAIPFANLYTASQILKGNSATGSLGAQTLQQEAALNIAVPYDSVFNGAGTKCIITKQGGAAVKGIDYDTAGGRITFKTAGFYTLEISNDSIKSNSSYPAKVIANYAAGMPRQNIDFTWISNKETTKYAYFSATSGQRVVVHWGDGDSTIYTGNGTNTISIDHTYTDSNSYNVSISGRCLFTYLSVNSSEVTVLDVSNAPDLVAIYCQDNLLTLGQLYAVSSSLPASNKYLGTQTFPSAETALNSPCVLTTDLVIKGKTTDFKIMRAGSNAVSGTDYTLNNGIITFKTSGIYFVEMTNDSILPTGTAKVVMNFIAGNVTDKQEISFEWKGGYNLFNAFQRSFQITASKNKKYIVNWGDGTTETFVGNGELSRRIHNYMDAKEYCVIIKGVDAECVFTVFRYDGSYDYSPLLSINVRKAKALQVLECRRNQLKSLDISNNNLLQELTCDGNALTDLDISNNPLLTFALVRNNRLDLKRLHEISQRIPDASQKRLGSQGVSPKEVALNTPVVITSYLQLGDSITIFTVQKRNGVAVAETDYTLSGGIITFKTNGIYTVEMSNKAIISSGLFPAKVIATYIVGSHEKEKITFDWEGNYWQYCYLTTSFAQDFIINWGNGNTDTCLGYNMVLNLVMSYAEDSVHRVTIEGLNAATSFRSLGNSDGKVNSVNIDKANNLTDFSCQGNKIPLSNLYIISEKLKRTNVIGYLGTQNLSPKLAQTNVPIDISSDTNYGGCSTKFVVKKGNNVANSEDYTLENSLLTFKTSGSYTLEMTNDSILSDSWYPAKVIATYTVGLNTDATLKSLAVNKGELLPVFHADSLNYLVTVADSVASIRIDAEKNHSNASISGNYNSNYNLRSGNNRFAITVTAENLVDKRTYVLNVIRVPDSFNVELSCSNNNHGNVSGNGKYRANEEVSISATPNTGYKFQHWVSSGTVLSTANPFTFSITRDTNIVAYFVLDSNTNNDAHLQDLSVDIPGLTPAFHADSTHYTLQMPCGNNSLTVAATPAGQGNVAYSIGGGNVSMPLAISQVRTQLLIRSTSANGSTTKDYHLSISHPFDSSIVVRMWDNVLSVVNNSAYNGGYTFNRYQWFADNTAISGATGGNLYLSARPAASSYTVELTTTDGITEKTCPVSHTPNRTKMTVFPNPATGKVTVRVIGRDAMHCVSTNVEIFNSFGILMETHPVNGDETEIDVSHLPTGMYWIRQNNENVKLIKQ